MRQCLIVFLLIISLCSLQGQEMVLAAALPTLPEVITSYTTVNNSCRDEIAGSNPTPFSTGCVDPNWSTTPPTSRNISTGQELLSTKAIKVGIQSAPFSLPVVGNLVWEDINGNGIQEATEPGVDGVRVHLIRDVNNNGVIDTNVDTTVLWTSTANDRLYSFSSFLPGDYFVQYSGLPSGFSSTNAYIGGDDSLDSDGLLVLDCLMAHLLLLLKCAMTILTMMEMG